MRLRKLAEQLAGRVAVAAGTIIRVTRRPSRMIPGLAGAGLAAYATSLIYYPAGLIVGAAFLLAFGAEVNRTPKPPEPPEYQ